jgi:tripartite-type tricarboxylate transporter receptor subunit TctC
MGRDFMLRISGAAAVMLAAMCGMASAQNWPTKTIRAVVPLSAGSATDIVARTVMDQLATQLGQSIIVENRTGAGNTIGMNTVAKADPDGYTILINSSTHTAIPATHANPSFDAVKDFTPIAPLGSVPVVLVALKEKGYKNIQDFVAAAKAKPGSINYTSAGAGNSSHLTGERFRLSAGFEAVHLPMKGAPEAMTEVLAGRSDFYFSPVLVAMPFIKDGKLQPLAVSGQQRASALPDVPTTEEAGYKNSYYNFWIGLFVPSKTPDDIKAKLYAETRKALDNPATREKLSKLGVDPMNLNMEQFAKLVNEEVEINGRLVEAAGLKVR